MNRNKTENKRSMKGGKSTNQRISSVVNSSSSSSSSSSGKRTSINVSSTDSKVSRFELQMQHMRQLLLFNLELIQQQKDWLTKKDEQIAYLKDQNEKLHSRLERLERRITMEKKRSIRNGNKQEESTDSCIRRIDFENDTKDSGECASTDDYGQYMTTKLPYRHLNHVIDFYTLSNIDDATNSKSPEKEDEVLVPKWRITVLPGMLTPDNGSNDILLQEELETLTDSNYAKRHWKHELEEKRRKRWDMQRIREEQLMEHLKKRSEEKSTSKPAIKSRKRKSTEDEQITSFDPSIGEIKSICVEDTIPVVAFGSTIPSFQASEFSLPWFDTNDIDVANEETVKTRRKSKRFT